jgi:hypothetical protein
MPELQGHEITPIPDGLLNHLDFMFLTRDDLKLSYGVDLAIGDAFINRAVPFDNLYWHNRKIYIPGSPGYYFMPIYADMLFRLGIEKSVLISDNHFKLNELILHEAAMVEHKHCTWIEHAEKLSTIIQPYAVQKELFQELKAYLVQEKPVQQSGTRLGTPFPSLNRADSYLFTLTALKDTRFNLQLALAGWYALMTYFLILDDLADIQEDLLNNEENAIVDAGLNSAGLHAIQLMIDQSIAVMKVINPVIANRIEHRVSQINLESYFQ